MDSNYEKLEDYCAELAAENFHLRAENKKLREATKRLTKQPVNNTEWVEPMHKDEIGFAVGTCPNCDCQVNDSQNYCDYCGQALDWRD